MLSRGEMCEIWNGAKYVASQDPEGINIGLAKLAMAIWAEACDLGHKPELTKEAREGFFASFACANVTESAFTEDSSLSKEASLALKSLTAESAVYDLGQLVKTATGGWASTLSSLPIIQKLKDISRMPQARGAVAGGLIGAGVGAARDDENRLRGAAMYALPGAAIGGLMGHGIHEYRGAQQQALADRMKAEAAEAAQAAMQAEHRRGRGQLGVDLLRDYFNSEPQMLQHIDINADDLMKHFGEHSHLPATISDRIRPEEHVDIHALLSRLGREKRSFFGGDPGMTPQEQDPHGMQQQMPQQAQGETLGDPNDMNGQIQDQGLSQEIDKGHKTVDNMIYLANQVNMPQLAQDMEMNRDELAVHFAEGNGYVPATLQHHFQQSEHAKAFMDKYKQRFGGL